MLILKVHYFLWFGSLAGVLPYAPVFGNQYSAATAEDIGFLYTVLPFVALLAKPLVCAFADRFAVHKLVLVVSLILTLVGFGSLVFVPWFQKDEPWTWWFFCSAVLTANTAMGVVTSMTDSMAMKEVSIGRSSFGSIRVYGTLGWGVWGLVAGGINNQVFTKLPYLLPGLIMFIIVICMDIMAILMFLHDVRDGGANEDRTSGDLAGDGGRHQVDGERRETDHQEQEKEEMSADAGDVVIAPGIWKDVMESFISFPSLFYYCFIVFMCGLLTSFHWSFFFWFLERIQPKDTLLMGLCLVVQSFLGEVPFFLFSETIVKKIGFDHSLSVTFLSIAIRYLSYGFLIKAGFAYFILIVELTQGPSFGLFYVVMTAIAQDYSLRATRVVQPRLRSSSPTADSLAGDHRPTVTSSPVVVKANVLTDRNYQPMTRHLDPREKTHATMQGIMSAAYEGAGLGVGALIAGLCMQRLGSERTWISAGFLSLAVAIGNFLLTLNLEKCSSRS